MCTTDQVGDSKLKAQNVQSVKFVLLAAAAVAISYADRSNISTAIISMSSQYSYSNTLSGFVLSSFFVGYTLTQIVGGKLADSDFFRGELLLPFAMVVWSAFTAITPFAASQGPEILLVSRVLLGAGEGLALPAVHSMISTYVPSENRTAAASFVTAGTCYFGYFGYVDHVGYNGYNGYNGEMLMTRRIPILTNHILFLLLIYIT
jgi:MFS family permease